MNDIYSKWKTKIMVKRGRRRNSEIISKPIKSRNFYWLRNHSTRIPYRLHSSHKYDWHMNAKSGFFLCSHEYYALLPKSQLFIIIADRTHFKCVDMVFGIFVRGHIKCTVLLALMYIKSQTTLIATSNRMNYTD